MRLKRLWHKANIIIFLLLLTFNSNAKEIAINEVILANSKITTVSSKIVQAEYNLNKTMQSYYPDLTTSLRWTKSNSRSIDGRHSLNFSWTLPIGINLSSKYTPNPSAQEKELNFSINWQIWPLSTYSSSNIALEDAKRALEQTINLEKDQILLDEINLYQSFRKAQIQREKVLLLKDSLYIAKQELEAAEKRYEQNLVGYSDVVDKTIQYRNANLSYQQAELNFQRQWESTLKKLSLPLNTLPELLVEEPTIPKIEWNLNEFYEKALLRDTEVINAIEALNSAQKKLKTEELRLFDLQASSNYAIPVLKENKNEWSVSLSFSHSLKSTLSSLERDEKKRQLDLALENYNETLNKLKDLLQTKYQDWQLTLYQLDTKEMIYRKTLNELLVKKTHLELGVISENDYKKFENSLRQSFLDWWDAALAYQVATFEILHKIGAYEKGGVLN